MKEGYIALQRLGDYARALLSHISIGSGRWESHSIRNGIFSQVLSCRNNIVNGNTGQDLREYYLHYVVDHRKIRLFQLLEAFLNDLPLALRSGIVCIHFPQACVGHRLNAVQMVHTRALQMSGVNSRGLDRLCDIGINVIELCLAQLYVHASQNIHCVHHGLPVKGSEIIDLEIQIPVQCLHCLLRPASEIRLVNLIIQSLIADIQIRIPENADQLNGSGSLVNVAYDNNIGIVPFAHRIGTAVHSKQSDGPVA